MKTLFIYSIFLSVFLLITFAAAGQPGLPGNPDQVPIDGGLGILAALGGAYAVKKLAQRSLGEGKLRNRKAP